MRRSPYQNYQRMQNKLIRDRESERASRAAVNAHERVRELEQQFDKLVLLCMAMWSFIEDKLSVTELDLIERMNQIDLQDGVLDGKLKRDIRACESCDRPLNPRFKKCLYCGAERPPDGPLDFR